MVTRFLPNIEAVSQQYIAHPSSTSHKLPLQPLQPFVAWDDEQLLAGNGEVQVNDEHVAKLVSLVEDGVPTDEALASLKVAGSVEIALTMLFEGASANTSSSSTSVPRIRHDGRAPACRDERRSTPHR